MPKIIRLEDKKKEKDINETLLWSGVFSCLHCHCKGEIQNVKIAKGENWFKCPECGVNKAYFMFPCERLGDLHWICDCGNHLFCIVKDGVYCPNCGYFQKGF